MSKAKSKFITQDHPWIISVFGSKNPFFVMLFASPLLLLFIHKLLKYNESISPFLVIVLFFVGMIYWSFVEYAIHGWVYHAKSTYKKHQYTIGSFHLYHHLDKFDLRVLNAGPVMIYAASMVLVAPIHFFFNDWAITSSIALGLLFSYVAYEFVHYFIHYKRYESGYMRFIQNYHFYHHDNAPLKNFGNTNPYWDKFFGTYDPGYKEYEMTETTSNSLITSQKSEATYA